jgi:hypothetical protein
MDYSNIWPLLTLLVTNILGPIIVWKFQQGRIDKDKHQVEMFEKLTKLLTEYGQLYYEYAVLVQRGDTVESFELQDKRRQMEAKNQEVENIKQIISRLTGKKIEYIKGTLPPLPPSGLKVTPQ